MLKLGPLHLHWSLLLGAALFCTAQPRPGLLLGYAAVLLVHVAGHALASRGASVRGVALHGLGGELLLEREMPPVQRSICALAGPLAQLAALAGAVMIHPSTVLAQDLADALGRRNLVVLLLNLIPLRPLDGAEGWRIFQRLLMKRLTTVPRSDLPVSRDVSSEVTKLLEKIRGSTKVR
jgi:stage IV sporulation protein FB